MSIFTTATVSRSSSTRSSSVVAATRNRVPGPVGADEAAGVGAVVARLEELDLTAPPGDGHLPHRHDRRQAVAPDGPAQDGGRVGRGFEADDPARGPDRARQLHREQADVGPEVEHGRAPGERSRRKAVLAGS
jgi:hypothetical protein